MWKYATILLIITGIIIGLIMTYHMLKVETLNDAWRMTRHDFVVLAKCPHKFNAWYNFFRRPELTPFEYSYGSVIVTDYAAVACTGKSISGRL